MGRRIKVPMPGPVEPELTPKQQAIFDVLWRVSGIYRFEVTTPQGTRYAVTGNVIRDAAREITAALDGLAAAEVKKWSARLARESLRKTYLRSFEGTKKRKRKRGARR